MTKQTYHVRRGFLTQGPTLDSLRRRPRDDEPEDDVIEIHNHVDDPDCGAATSEKFSPQDRRRGRDDEELEPDDKHGKVVAKYPPGHHAETAEDGSIVVYDAPPGYKTDILDFKIDDASRTRDRCAPRTLAELNAFFRRHYPRRKATAAR